MYYLKLCCTKLYTILFNSIKKINKSMKILAIDIGTGTQDIMIYDATKELENSVKIVLPSPHIYISQTIENTKNDIFLTGEIMGGGKIKNTLIKHMEKGYDVVMGKTAAKTIRDDPEQVKSYGIKIADEKNYKNYTTIELKDINIPQLSSFIKNYDLNFNFDRIAVAVQDHGYSEKMGDRDFRFEKIKEKLTRPIPPKDFGFFENVPAYYTRMNAVKRTLAAQNIKKPTLIMDTKFASITGMCEDETAKKHESFIAIDIGNGHTTAASIENGLIQGVFEHHTSSLNGEKLEYYIKRLAEGTITNSEVYNDHGHGACVINPISKLEKVIVSGPKRELIKKTGLDWHNAVPAGDVMMTGTVGLVKTMLGD